MRPFGLSITLAVWVAWVRKPDGMRWRFHTCAIQFQQVVRCGKPEAPLTIFKRRMNRQVEPVQAFRRLPE